MLFRVHPERNPFEDNPGLEAVPAFNRLEPMQMRFVILFADPSKDNPIRTLAGRERRERAAILAGYKLEPNGKRLARNGREVVYGRVDSIEEAIEEFKKNYYDEKAHNREALKKQIAEIREFLTSDKRTPMLNKQGQIIMDKHGNELYETDQKGLKLAVELGVKLPELEKALAELEAYEPEPKYEGLTGTIADLPEDVLEESGDLPEIELFHQMKK